jgi:hypothetical protein
LLVVSLFIPWWTITIGDNLAKISVSPVNTSFSILGTSFVPPLIWALNLVGALSMALGGTIMLIYSVIPQRSFSKRLLGFSYPKPIYAVIMFVVVLIALSFIVESMLGFGIPIMGSQSIQVPQSMTQNVIVNISASAGFEWPFWLAIGVAVLCVAARLFHSKVAAPVVVPVQPVAPPTV